jgi:hypothetical protein
VSAFPDGDLIDKFPSRDLIHIQLKRRRTCCPLTCEQIQTRCLIYIEGVDNGGEEKGAIVGKACVGFKAIKEEIRARFWLPEKKQGIKMSLNDEVELRGMQFQ